MWAAVLNAYDESIEKYGEDNYGGLTAGAAAIENMRLVYLRRKDGELWVPPNER